MKTLKYFSDLLGVDVAALQGKLGSEWLAALAHIEPGEIDKGVIVKTWRPYFEASPNEPFSISTTDNPIPAMS